MTPTPNSLTDTEIDAHCGNLLPSVTRYITRTMGEEAATHTGECLFEALRKYERGRGDVLPYARSKTRLLVIEALRRIDGRKGTAKYAATSTKCDLADYDGFEVADDPGDRIEHDEALIQTLKVIDRAAKMQRVLLFARLLVGLTDKEIQRITDVSETKIRTETLSLRELVPVD